MVNLFEICAHIALYGYFAAGEGGLWAGLGQVHGPKAHGLRGFGTI